MARRCRSSVSPSTRKNRILVEFRAESGVRRSRAPKSEALRDSLGAAGLLTLRKTHLCAPSWKNKSTLRKASPQSAPRPRKVSLQPRPRKQPATIQSQRNLYVQLSSLCLGVSKQNIARKHAIVERIRASWEGHDAEHVGFDRFRKQHKIKLKVLCYIPMRRPHTKTTTKNKTRIHASGYSTSIRPQTVS